MTRLLSVAAPLCSIVAISLFYFMERRASRIIDDLALRLARAEAERDALHQALEMLGQTATLTWETENTLRIQIHGPAVLGAKPLSRESLN